MDKESTNYIVAKHMMANVLMYNERFSLDDGHLKYIAKNLEKRVCSEYLIDIIIADSLKISGIPYGYWCDLPFPLCLREFSGQAMIKVLGSKNFYRSFIKLLACIAKYGVLQSFYSFWFYSEPCDEAVMVMAELLTKYINRSDLWRKFEDEAIEFYFDSLNRSDKSFMHDTTFIEEENDPRRSRPRYVRRNRHASIKSQ